jgi:hypothetical protein
MRRSHVLATLTTVLSCASTGLLAQEDGLDRAESLVREGRANEARVVLVSWWDQRYEDAGRSDQQRALWLRARLTVSPDEATRDYQRLVVLYPTGPYADRALLRLAQAAHAMGAGSQARAHVEALVRDYPGSPVRREAETWLRAAGDPDLPADRGMAESDAVGGAPPPEGTPAANALTGPFSVQLGAFGELSRARAVFGDAMAAGFDARLVRVEGSPLLHVRVGSFPERDPAQALFERLARAGLPGAVVRDERSERRAEPS